MLLYLIIRKLEYLETVWECSLSRLCLSEVVGNLLVWESLFNVLIVEVHNCVPIREAFPLHTIIKNNFLFAVCVDPLNLAIVANNLFNDLAVSGGLAVVLLRELKAVVLVLRNLGSLESIADLLCGFIPFNLLVVISFLPGVLGFFLGNFAFIVGLIL